MPRINLSEAATEELDDAYRWYESQRAGLGDELLDEFLRSSQRVADNPRLYPVVDGETRRALLHRFPYGIFYRIQGDTILVIAFFHAKRDPVQWRRRR